MRGCWENSKQLCITCENSPTPNCACCGLILSLVQILFFPLLQTHYHVLLYPNTKETKIYTKDKIEP